ncbi:MAG: hypothetical protein QXJ68_06540 [Methanocellales archaeon]
MEKREKEGLDEVDLRFKLVIINFLLIIFLLVAVVIIWYLVRR